MNILAFEAANFALSLALMKENQIVQRFCSENLFGQDTELLPAIEHMLQQHKLSYRDLDLIATTTGPGSFTGIRMALATAEGLALASGIPAVAFNSLEWVAQSYASLYLERLFVLVALESKRKDVYCQLFDHHGDSIKPPRALLPAELEAYLEGKEVTCIGSGSYKFKDVPLTHPCHFVPYEMPTAADLGAYAWRKIVELGVSAFPCDPFYLRLPDVTLSISQPSL